MLDFPVVADQFPYSSSLCLFVEVVCVNTFVLILSHEKYAAALSWSPHRRVPSMCCKDRSFRKKDKSISLD